MGNGSGISIAAAAVIRGAIKLAGGREVCFVATLDEQGVVATARAVARGDASSVLALPGCAGRGEMLVHNHPSGLLEPSQADMHVAQTLYLDGVGFGIVNNDATSLYVVVEIPRDRVETQLDPHEVANELCATGKVGGALAEHEDRESQRALTRTITQLYNRKGIGVLEAGTGVGKSLAYLLPALRWSAANGERTVVSTNTINLQEQITGNDLPLLAQALTDQKVRFTLLKGWRNYLCLSRLESAAADAVSLFEDDASREVAQLVSWAAQSENGSLSDLTVQPRAEVWDEVAAEADLCTRNRCKFFEHCFVFRARRAAAQSDVVVVNHHLLMADLSVRRMQQNWSEAAVLPSYNRLVIDEGHHLEEAAGKHLGLSVGRRGVARLLSRLERRGKGLLTTLRARFAIPASTVEAASYDLIESRLSPSVDAARRVAGDVFDLLERHVRDQGTSTVRITQEFGRENIWREGLERSLDDLLGEFTLLGDALDRIRERLTSADSGEADLPVIAELRGVTRRLGGAGDALQATLRPAQQSEPSVRWLENKGREANVVATSVPLDLSGILREDLFRHMKTTIVTSATLSVGGSFNFVRERLGLTEPDVEPVARVFPSSFHFEDQALLAVPTDFPSPSEKPEEHREHVIEAVKRIVELADGGIFVLCTSYRDVKHIAASLRQSGIPARWPLLVHGEEESRDLLLRRFRDSGRAVLLGTTSFWEGVDVRGSALRGIVIVRLPFKVPTEPMTAANCEAIAARGGDPFDTYLLPLAALRLKQGFGRLVRSGTDWGAVVITDPRLATMRYGESILESLPPAERLVAPWSEVSAGLRKFYEQRRR